MPRRAANRGATGRPNIRRVPPASDGDKNAGAQRPNSGRGAIRSDLRDLTPDELDRQRILLESGSTRPSMSGDMGIIIPGENIDGSGEGPLYEVMHTAVGRYMQGSLVRESNFVIDGVPFDNVDRLLALGAIRPLNKTESREAEDDLDEMVERLANIRAEQMMRERDAAEANRQAQAGAGQGPVNPPDEHPASKGETTIPPDSTGAAVPAEHPEKAFQPPTS
jgi:hypothetical protein